MIQKLKPLENKNLENKPFLAALLCKSRLKLNTLSAIKIFQYICKTGNSIDFGTHAAIQHSKLSDIRSSSIGLLALVVTLRLFRLGNDCFVRVF